MNRRGFIAGLLASALTPPALVMQAVEKASPSVVLPNYAELVALTRKAFLPRLHMQVYEISPFVRAALSSLEG